MLNTLQTAIRLARITPGATTARHCAAFSYCCDRLARTRTLSRDEIIETMQATADQVRLIEHSARIGAR